MPNYQSISGKVIAYEDFPVGDAAALGCYKIITLRSDDAQITRFITSPYTYFVDGFRISLGSRIAVFYDTDVPTILIYPPQYRAIVVAHENRKRNVTVDFFDTDLVDSKGRLKLIVSPSTKIILRNGQPFTQNPASHYLIVIYGATTRSIPAITNPNQIIVLCKQP
ncbi:MAG: hypothetical protein GX303_06900 [Clostridiales bacterium]|nr:hypothetical protein [Clostridiales bacterium]